MTLMYSAYNITVARRWQEKRRRIRAVSGDDRLRLLRSFGEAVRALPPPSSGAAAAAPPEDDPLFDAVIGAWLSLDPSNPDWPGRDRLFLTRREDLAPACAVLSICGFFPPGKLPAIAEHVDASGRNASVPGIEAPGVPAGEIPQLLWESAAASARDKKRWRDMFGQGGAWHGRGAWISPDWRGSAETWRSCVVLDAEDGVAAACRDLALRKDEPAAGLAALVKAPENSAPDILEAWADAGWKAVLANGRDILQIHNVLTGAQPNAPLAVVLAVPGREPKKRESAPAPLSPADKALARRHAAELLGELPDEQFTALFDESLRDN